MAFVSITVGDTGVVDVTLTAVPAIAFGEMWPPTTYSGDPLYPDATTYPDVTTYPKEFA